MSKLKNLLIIMALTLAATSVGASTPPEIFPDCSRGNVDKDPLVTLRDIRLIDEYIRGSAFLSCHHVMHADANRDRRVDERDVELLESELGGLPSERTWGDVDGNGIANEYDFWLLEYYVSEGSFPYEGMLLDAGDINGDGIVNQADIEVFLDCESGYLTSPFSQNLIF